MKSKKKTRTERIERQVASMELLATVGELPPRLQFKLIELKAKLTRLYHGAAKRQMQGLVVRKLHDAPPFERKRWSGFGIVVHRIPENQLPKPRIRGGRAKKSILITQQKIEYENNATP